MFQIEVWKSQEYFVYFKIFKPISWGKRPAERRSQFIQRFLKFAFRIFDQAYRFCHCEEGAIFAPDAAIFNDAICHPETNYG